MTNTKQVGNAKKIHVLYLSLFWVGMQVLKPKTNFFNMMKFPSFFTPQKTNQSTNLMFQKGQPFPTNQPASQPTNQPEKTNQPTIHPTNHEHPETKRCSPKKHHRFLSSRFSWLLRWRSVGRHAVGSLGLGKLGGHAPKDTAREPVINKEIE